jgi:hypothetical protein
MSIYIYSRTIFPTVSSLRNLTQDEVNEIPVRERLRVTAEPLPTPLPTPGPGGTPVPSPSGPPDLTPRFRVDRQLVQTQAGEDIGKQLITTISTLVVAISAFYFGSNSVLAAQAAVTGGVTFQVLIAGSGRRKVKRGTMTPIAVLTVPRSQPLNTSVVGDEASALRRIDDENYAYTPGKGAGATVTITFTLASRPEVSGELVIEVEETEPTSGSSDHTDTEGGPDAGTPVTKPTSPQTPTGSAPPPGTPSDASTTPVDEAEPSARQQEELTHAEEYVLDESEPQAPTIAPGPSWTLDESDEAKSQVPERSQAQGRTRRKNFEL